NRIWKGDRLRTGARNHRRFIVGIAVTGSDILHHDFVAELPVRLQPALGSVGLTADTQRPCYFFIDTPILRANHLEDKLMPAGLQIGRLDAITSVHLLYRSIVYRLIFFS